MRRLLVVSCHLAGGCFQYSNAIISRMKVPAEVYVPRKVAEPSILSQTHTFLLWGYPFVLKCLSLVWLLAKICVLGVFGYYKALLLFGYAGWDYFIIKAWKLTGRPSYFVVHDGKMHDGEANDKQQGQLLYLMRNATHLVFLSKYVMGGVEKHFNICKPCCIVPHGLIDYGAVAEKDQSRIPTLLFLGRVSRYKGIDVLLSAIGKVPEELYDKLIIAGNWETDIPVPESSNKIEIINKYLSADEILEVIGRADVMLFPYIEATQSGVATLALNYRKPSIVTDVGAFREQFTEKSALFIEPKAPDKLTDAIEFLAKHQDIRQSMVDALTEERKEYEWTHITQKLEEYILSTTKLE